MNTDSFDRATDDQEQVPDTDTEMNEHCEIYQDDYRESESGQNFEAFNLQ